MYPAMHVGGDVIVCVFQTRNHVTALPCGKNLSVEITRLDIRDAVEQSSRRVVQ